jgi:hypothetical protein
MDGLRSFINSGYFPWYGYGGVWIRIGIYTSNEIWSKAWRWDLVAH